jgi:uridine phosphorylase
MLNLSEQSDDDVPVFTAADWLAYRWRTQRAPKISPPQSVIIAYQHDPIATLLKRYHHTRVTGFSGELHLLKTRGKPIGMLQPSGPGAPLVAALAEELIAFGVQRFVSIGLAGGLQPNQRPGNVILSDCAWRDEGTSYHYLPPARSIEPDAALTQQVATALTEQGIVYSTGTSWTTDAPYRETRRKVAACRAEGVKTVEMEAAALFAVGQRLKVAMAAVFVIGDHLADLTWQPAVEAYTLRQSLVAVAEAIVAALSAE